MSDQYKIKCEPYTVNDEEPDYPTLINFSITDGKTVKCYSIEIDKIMDLVKNPYSFKDE